MGVAVQFSTRKRTGNVSGFHMFQKASKLLNFHRVFGERTSGTRVEISRHVSNIQQRDLTRDGFIVLPLTDSFTLNSLTELYLPEKAACLIFLWFRIPSFLRLFELVYETVNFPPYWLHQRCSDKQPQSTLGPYETTTVKDGNV